MSTMSTWRVLPSRPASGLLPRQRGASPAAAPTSGGPPEPEHLSRTPWRALCPPRTVELRDPDLPALQRLPSGTPVALLSDRVGSRDRLRRLARRAGVRIERELVVVPSTTSPIVTLDDTEAAVRHFWTSVAAVPPGLTWTGAPATVALLAARHAPWRCTGAALPGRVLVGTRR